MSHQRTRETFEAFNEKAAEYNTKVLRFPWGDALHVPLRDERYDLVVLANAKAPCVAPNNIGDPVIAYRYSHHLPTSAQGFPTFLAYTESL